MNHDTLTRCFSFFLSFTLTHIVLSCSLSLCNGLTLHRWVCVGTSSEVLMGHTHDGQVNKQAGLGCGDLGSWSKVRITGKSQSSMQGHISPVGWLLQKSALICNSSTVLLLQRVTKDCLLEMTPLTKTCSISNYDMYTAYDQFPSCLCHSVSNRWFSIQQEQLS